MGYISALTYYSLLLQCGLATHVPRASVPLLIHFCGHLNDPDRRQ